MFTVQCNLFFFRYGAQGYPFRANFEDSAHFDSVDQYDLPAQSEIDFVSANSMDTFPFSLWQLKGSTENAAELSEFKIMLKDKNIVHLMARPLQVYYLDNEDEDNSTKAFVCKNSKLVTVLCLLF